MLAVIFEVKPKAEQWEAYLAIAAALRPALEKTEGFISNERFTSLRRAGWLLSLSLWRDEKSLVRWRTAADHHRAQTKGRAAIFADYHLRVGEVLWDSGIGGAQSLQEQRPDVTETGAAKSVTLIERQFSKLESQYADPAALAAACGLPRGNAAGDPAEWDIFESIVAPGRFLALAAGLQGGEPLAEEGPADGGPRRSEVHIIRDYGMFDRREAPQFHPPITAPAARDG